MKLYPAMDLMGGCCVRLAQGVFDSKTVYDAEPAAVLSGFRKAGAEFVHVVDLDGAKDPAKRQTALIERLAGTSGLKIQAGGGVRAEADVDGLLAAGAERVVVGTMAVEEPARFTRLLERLGGGRLTLALDVSMGPDGATRVATRGWSRDSGAPAEDLVARFLIAGLRRVLCTDIAKDGMLAGPNIDLYRRLCGAFPTLEVQASGGVRGLEDLLELKGTGAHSAIVGKALYEGRLDLAEAVARC